MNQQSLFVEDDPAPATANPILKWAGGKSSLLAQFEPLFPAPSRYSRYFEPFLGGAAVYFFLQPKQSFLFDVNTELIDVYTTVRDDVERLIQALKHHENTETHFYAVREQKPSTLNIVERAARFIFLNRTCYNGLYRVNKSGQFNVPFGRYKNPTICDEKGLRVASAALKSAHLAVADFENVLEYAQKGDLIYFDPPYEPITPTSNFTSYTSGGFTSDDQRRLANVFRVLDERGCLLMLSNSNAQLICDLYVNFRIHEISARRLINSKPEGRGVIIELLITNF